MEVIILAGGFGKRLRDTVSDVPKPLAPIQDIPFLDILLDQVGPFVERTILAIGYKAEVIKTYYENRKISFSEEEEPLGTGGAVKKALQLVESSTLLVLNGDSYFGVDLQQLIASHQERSADLTIACREVGDVARYGSLFFDPGGRVRAFHEKIESSGRGWINGGIYVMEKRLLEGFSDDVFSLEQDAFPSLLDKRVYAFPSTGKFIDIGTKESYFEAQHFFR